MLSSSTTTVSPPNLHRFFNIAITTITTVTTIRIPLPPFVSHLIITPSVTSYHIHQLPTPSINCPPHPSTAHPIYQLPIPSINCPPIHLQIFSRNFLFPEFLPLQIHTYTHTHTCRPYKLHLERVISFCSVCMRVCLFARFECVGVVRGWRTEGLVELL